MGMRHYFSEGIESRTKDERILNVIRESEAGFVGTTEVMNDEDVDLKYDAVKNRLEDLEESGRVRSKMVGDANNGTLAWYLDEQERERPVNPENYWSANIIGEIRKVAEMWIKWGRNVAVAAMMLLVVSLSTEVFGMQVGVLSPSFAGAWSYKFAIAGFAVVAFGGAVMWGSNVTELVIERNSSLAD
jgi:hypothetical protein